MLNIDGTIGEGGGQVLRSSLALSIITQTPFTLSNIRAKRKKGGLGKQHLTSVLAAAQISNATVTGAVLGSKKIVFTPQKVVGDTYIFKIGSAGSALLVLQTILPPLLMAPTPSTVTIFGGTHNQKAPSADFFEKAFLPLLSKMGAQVTFSCERYGFYPVGGGKIVVTITPTKLTPLSLLHSGATLSMQATALSAHRPLHHLTKQAEALSSILPSATVVTKDVVSAGHGGSVVVEIAKEHCTSVFTGFSKRDIPSSITAQVVAQKALEYANNSYVLDSHLTDQIMLPLVLAGRGEFSCAPPSLHSTTNSQVIALFMDTAPTFTQTASNWQLSYRM